MTHAASDPRLPLVSAELERLLDEVRYFPAGGPRFRRAQSQQFWTSLPAHLRQGARVLDLGCGPAARWRRLLEAYEVEWHGADVLPRDAVAREARPRYRQVVDDRLPFEAGEFDAVAMIDVLEHFRRPEAMMAEVSRVLRPGGALVGTSAFWQLEHDSYCHYTLKGLRALLEAHGFDVDELTPSAHSGLVLVAQRFFGGSGRIVAHAGKRALLRSVLKGVATAPIFYGLQALELLRKATPLSDVRGRDDLDCASIYFRARRAGGDDR